MTGENFGAWLRHQMRRREWHQAEMARQSGLSSAVISRWLTGVNVPSPSNCLKLAETLFVSSDDVLAIAGHRIPDRPIADDDPISELTRMMKQMDPKPDRVNTLRAILQMYLETDHEPQDSLLVHAA